MVIQDKVAIVTGASSGIGEATAKVLTKLGAKVALAARSKDKLDTLSKQLKDSLVIPTDMRDDKAIKKMVQKTVDHFGRVDILVNNAGRGYDASVEKMDPKMFEELFKLNLVGPLLAMQEVISHMRKQGGGAIVNLSSGTSLMNIPDLSAYASLKRALNGLSLTAREELKVDKIIVSLVYPYITETNFGKNIMGGARYERPQDRDDTLPPGDSSEYVAEKIAEVIESGEAEIFAHDWMKNIK